MSAKFATGAHGELLVIVTTPSPGLDVGDHFRVIGNTLLVTLVDAPGVVGWLGTPTGRPANHEEALQARPSRARPRRAPPLELADELLDDDAAIEAARVEQQRAPGDLISAVLPG